MGDTGKFNNMSEHFVQFSSKWKNYILQIFARCYAYAKKLVKPISYECKKVEQLIGQKNIILSKVSQAQKTKNCMFLLILNGENLKTFPLKPRMRQGVYSLHSYST
jgi:hypothetical protein